MANEELITVVEFEISQLKACLKHEGINYQTGGIWAAIVKRLQDATDRAKSKPLPESPARSVEVKSRDNLLEATKNLLECFKKSFDCSDDKCEVCHRSSISVHGICRATTSAIAAEEARQAAWIANGKKPNKSLMNLSLVTGVPMEDIERYLGGSESVKLTAYRAALEVFKADALCNCESTGKACLLCFELEPNEHNLCTSLRNLIAKLEKEEEDK